ncbi:MAG: anthranilate synthase component I [Armatimonadota bacterium]|jgi:anthranilate synthase component 1
MNRYYPDKEEFIRRAKMGNMTPLYKEILADTETPVSAFKKIAEDDYCFLLESVEGGERLARFSFLGSGTNLVIKSKCSEVEIIRAGVSEKTTLEPGRDVLHLLKDELESLNYVADENLPRFCGGAVGFLSYDLVRFFMDLPDSTVDDMNLPDCTLIFTDTLLIFDHVKHRIRVVCNARIDGDPEGAYDKAIERIEELASRLRRPAEMNFGKRDAAPLEVKSNFTKDEYEKMVLKCKEYIDAGEIVQVVPSQRFSTKVTADAFDIYRSLRSLNPSPYMYFLKYQDVTLVGSSPEILVTDEKGKVTVRPIAGTRKRGKDIAEDRALEEELLGDAKEKSEHMMLVDLGEYDLAKVCEPDTINVDELMVIERYSHVMHIVSSISGRLRKDQDQFEVLRATFPAGTVSGAPKKRALEIIDEVEPTRRGPYAGAIGYFSYSGDMDACITIRTILLKDGTAYVQAGGGVVADSVPEKEYQETVNKAMGMIKALSSAEEGLE